MVLVLLLSAPARILRPNDVGAPAASVRTPFPNLVRRRLRRLLTPAAKRRDFGNQGVGIARVGPSRPTSNGGEQRVLLKPRLALKLCKVHAQHLKVRRTLSKAPPS